MRCTSKNLNFSQINSYFTVFHLDLYSSTSSINQNISDFNPDCFLEQVAF